MAVIGGLAYKAYQDWQARQAGQQPQPLRNRAGRKLLPPPNDTPFTPKATEAESRARLLVTAMISAAKADGYIDQAEQKHIFDKLDATGLDTESKAYVMDQLRAPLDLDAIVRDAQAAGGRGGGLRGVAARHRSRPSGGKSLSADARGAAWPARAARCRNPQDRRAGGRERRCRRLNRPPLAAETRAS